MRLLTLFALLMLPRVTFAQELHVTLVKLAGNVQEHIAQTYNPERERLWCATEWEVSAQYDSIRQVAVSVIVVTRVRDETDAVSSATFRHMELTGAECKTPEGKYLPMIHSHPIGECQASPADLLTMMPRRSPFDGIMCGDRFAVWYFQPQILASVLWDWEQKMKPASGSP